MSLIDAQIQENRDTVDAQAEKWEYSRSVLEPLVVNLQALGIEPRLDKTYSFDIPFSGNKEKLNAVWGAVRLVGYTFPEDNERPKENEFSWSGWFNPPDPDMFQIWLSFTSIVCRQVKVGTKMEEVPIYEVRCGE